MKPVVMFVMCAVLLGGAYGSTASAQTIKYKVGTNSDVTVTSGEDIEIDVGAVNGTLLVRIWDPTLDGNSLPNDSVGKVTITGTFTSGQLRILVGGRGMEVALWRATEVGSATSVPGDPKEPRRGRLSA